MEQLQSNGHKRVTKQSQGRTLGKDEEELTGLGGREIAGCGEERVIRNHYKHK